MYNKPSFVASKNIKSDKFKQMLVLQHEDYQEPSRKYHRSDGNHNYEVSGESTIYI